MKKGMTFLTVVIAIIIVLIFASTATIAVINVSNNSKKIKFATEIAYVQEAVDNYYEKNREYPIKASVNVDINNVNSSDISQFLAEDKEDNIVMLYEIDYSLIGNIETIRGNRENGADEDIYAVSKKTGNVYYIKGERIGNVTYFTLTDELKDIIDYTQTNENAIVKDSISFIPSTLEWTNENIVTKILVPDNYTNISVIVLNNGNTTTISENYHVEDHYEYIVDSIQGNYSINVTYTNNLANSLTQTYSVTNFDNSAPTLDVSNRVDLKSTENDKKYSYIKVSNQKDDLSGIKCIKYERENIADDDIKTYFKTNGIELQGDIIEIDDSTKYVTIYIEDNAGNFTRAQVNVSI